MPYRYWTLLVSLLLVVSGCQQRSLNDGPTTIDTGETVPVDECPVPDSSTVSLRINELMIENQSTIPTQDNDYLPWIELYNTGSEDVVVLSPRFDRLAIGIQCRIESPLPKNFFYRLFKQALWLSGEDFVLLDFPIPVDQHSQTNKATDLFL